MSHVCDLGPFAKRLGVESLDELPAQVVDSGECLRGYREGARFHPSTLDIRLVLNAHPSSASSLFEDLPICLLERVRSVENDKEHVRNSLSLPGPQHAFLLDRIRCRTKTGGVDHCHPEAIELDDLGEEGARGAWNVRDDRTRCAEQRVEQARFPDIWLSHDRDLEAFSDQSASFGLLDESGDTFQERVDCIRQLSWIDEVIAFLGKIDRRLQPGDQIEQTFGD